MSDSDKSFSLDAERGASIVSGKKSGSSSKMAVVGTIVVVGGLIVYFGWPDSGAKKAQAGPQTVIRQTMSYEPPPPLPVTAAALPVVLPSPAVQEKAAEDGKMLIASRKAPVMAFNKGGAKAGGGGSSAQPVGVSGPEEKNELETKLKSTPLEGVRAGTLGNRDFIIAQGTSIPCVLETAMSSDQPGFVTCVITRDVLSDNGRVVLLDRGSQVTGEYRGGLKRGQRRMFVLWTRAKTPKGVIIALASPGTDALGRAGFDGEVDTHWWERFGSSMALSLVDDLAQLATGRLLNQGGQNGGSNNNQNNFQSTQDSGKDAAAIAVQESINIPPTLNKDQGELVNIFVARDLDFSNVYGLKVTEGRARIYDRGASGDFERFSGAARQ